MAGRLRRLAIAVLGLLAAGCGAADPPPARTLAEPTAAPAISDGDRQRLRADEARIQAHCVAVARSLVEPEAAPTPAEEAEAFAAADDLVALVRTKPAATVEAGQDLRLYLGDVVENLEGANCDPRMLARLERGLATIPRS